MTPPPPWLTAALNGRAYDPEHSATARELASREATRYRAQFGQITPGDLLAIFQDLLFEFYSTSIARQRGHKYLLDIPYDRTRLIPRNSEYINASWVRELHGGKVWIVQQAPIEPDRLTYVFLSMLFEPSDVPTNLNGLPDPNPNSGIRTVIQLGDYWDDDGKRSSCQYLPEEIRTSKAVYGDPPSRPFIRAKLVSRQTDEHAKCVRSTVTIQRYSAKGSITGTSHTFQHLRYTGLLDGGGPPVASDIASFIAFATLVHEVNRELGTDPVMVVGSCLGVGITGTFLALCSLLRANGLLPGYRPMVLSDHPTMPATPLGVPVENFDEVEREIDSLREQKPMRLKSADMIAQQRFLYEALRYAFEHKQDRSAEAIPLVPHSPNQGQYGVASDPERKGRISGYAKGIMKKIVS